MLLGAHIFPGTNDPEVFAETLVQKGYRAGYFPEGDYHAGQTDRLAAIRTAFEKRGLTIAEVGAWRNPFDTDPQKARENRAYIIDRLAIADEVGARCCVDTVGSIAETSVDAANIGDDFYTRCVDWAREAVDTVRPTRTKMSFELLPFNFLDSAEMYERFVRDIDRPAVAVHLDPVNLIVSPRLYYDNAAVFREAIRRLAPLGIVSMHLKDLIMHPGLPNTYLEEVPLGQGGMDIRAMLRAIDEFLPADVPLMLEHLPDGATYERAADAARRFAAEAGVTL